MKIQHLMLIGATVVVALLVAYGYRTDMRRQRAIGDAAAASPERPSAQVGAAEVARLRGELGSLRSELAEMRKGAAALAVAPSPPAAEAELTAGTLEQQREESEQQWHDHMSEVAMAFDTEPRDGRWSAATSQLLRSALTENAALAVMAGAIDCRSTTCRVEIERDEAGSVDKQLPQFLNGLAAALPQMEAEHSEHDGKSHYTLYLKAAPKVAPAPRTNH